jgi:oligopeptide/dipeptide ABC transporter ATP-binding protein
VFQDPFSALNPRMTVRHLIEEPLVVHRKGNAAARAQRVGRLIEMVGLSRRQLDRYPHEFSGGQRQRIAIARAIAIEPKVLLADEPLSALDVSVQAQIINLLQDLKSELGLTLILISHDLSVVSYISDRIGVMHAGHMVETGTADAVFDGPAHPYTRTLLDAVPHPDPATREIFAVAQPDRGSVASQGCPYRKRCSYASDICKDQAPALDPAGASDHLAACHHWRAVMDAPGGHAPTEMPYAERLSKYAAQVRAARKQATHEREV